MSLSVRRWSDDGGPLTFSFPCCHLEAGGYLLDGGLSLLTPRTTRS